MPNTAFTELTSGMGWGIMPLVVEVAPHSGVRAPSYRIKKHRIQEPEGDEATKCIGRLFYCPDAVDARRVRVRTIEPRQRG